MYAKVIADRLQVIITYIINLDQMGFVVIQEARNNTIKILSPGGSGLCVLLNGRLNVEIRSKARGNTVEDPLHTITHYSTWATNPLNN